MGTLSSEIRLRVSATEALRTFALVSQEFSGVVIMTTIEDVHSRLRAEFSEMPGMLCIKTDGHYARVTAGGDAHRRFPAKSDLRVERRIARAS
jgi:hypothetical protein